MKMSPYISLDLETTGLEPDYCQILEVGAVFDFPHVPLADCPTFHTYVRHKTIVGDPFALGLNANILKRIAAQPKEYNFCCLDDVMVLLSTWINKHWPMREKKVTFAGKNFGSFDLQFLKRLPSASLLNYNHRSYDIGTMYFDPLIDEVPPNLSECLGRAGYQRQVAHEALADAMAVAKLVRFKYGFHFQDKPCHS